MYVADTMGWNGQPQLLQMQLVQELTINLHACRQAGLVKNTSTILAGIQKDHLAN